MIRKRNLVPIPNNSINNALKEVDYAQDSLLYINIIQFATEVNHLEPFKFRELANWLLDNNIELRNEFYGSHISKSYKVHSKTNFIQTRLNEVIAHGMIKQVGTAKADKSDTLVPLYQFTLLGILMLDVDSPYNNHIKSSIVEQKSKELFYENAKSVFKKNYSIELEFYLLLLDKLYDQTSYEEFIGFAGIFIPEFNCILWAKYF